MSILVIESLDILSLLEKKLQSLTEDQSVFRNLPTLTNIVQIFVFFQNHDFDTELKESCFRLILKQL